MRSRFTDFGSVRTKLFAALGLTPLVAGCGAMVVLEDDGAGGSGGGGTTQTVGPTTVASSSTGFTCDAPEAVVVCADQQAGLCPPADSTAAYELMQAEVEHYEECERYCYCSTFVASVACGPDPAAVGGCCYWVHISEEMTCMGRPYVVDGSARVAALAPRSDWSARTDVDPGALDPAARRAIAAAWARDASFEHASVASFARFTLDLLALGAPARLVREAQRAMADEIRHAELCFGVATAIGGEPVGPGGLDVDAGSTSRREPAAILEAVVHEGCVGETLSALVVMAARDAATDHATRSALEEIARDEMQHAQLAWATVVWACTEGPDDLRAAVVGALRAAQPDLDPGPDLDVDPDMARAFGQLRRGERLAIIRRGFDEVVRPLVAALTKRPEERVATETRAELVS